MRWSSGFGGCGGGVEWWRTPVPCCCCCCQRRYRWCCWKQLKHGHGGGGGASQAERRVDAGAPPRSDSGSGWTAAPSKYPGGGVFASAEYERRRRNSGSRFSTEKPRLRGEHAVPGMGVCQVGGAGTAAEREWVGRRGQRSPGGDNSRSLRRRAFCAGLLGYRCGGPAVADLVVAVLNLEQPCIYVHASFLHVFLGVKECLFHRHVHVCSYYLDRH